MSVPRVVTAWSWNTSTHDDVIMVNEGGIVHETVGSLRERVKDSLIAGSRYGPAMVQPGEDDGKGLVVEYDLGTLDESKLATLEREFSDVHRKLVRANNPNGRERTLGDSIVPIIVSKYREANRLWVLFDTRDVALGHDRHHDVLLSGEIPTDASRQSIWSYVSQLWKAGMYSASTTKEATPFAVLQMGPPVRDGRYPAADLVVLFVDLLSLRQWREQPLRKLLRDETTVVQNDVEQNGMGFSEALSRLAIVFNEQAAKYKLLPPITHRLRILRHFLPLTAEERAAEPAVQEWTKRLLQADRAGVTALLRDRRMLDVLEKTAPEVADRVAVGDYVGAEELIRRASDREGEIRRHGEMVDVTNEIMQAFVSGDPDEALEALRMMKKQKILNETIPGMQSAIQRGDDEAVRKLILDYRRKHKKLDDDLDRDDDGDDDEGLLRRFSSTRFGKTLRDGLTKLSTRGGATSTRSGAGGSSSSDGGPSTSWVVFRWFDFAKPDRQWVRREH